MTECERIRAAAPGLAALPPDDPERAAAREHARTCPGCAEALLEGERLEALLGGLAPDALPAGAASGVARAIREELAREVRRRLVGSLVALAAALVLLVTLAHARSHSAGDWALSAALAATAVLLASLAGRFTLGAASAAVAAALGAALLGGRAGPLEAGMGLHCLLSEVAAGGLVLVAVRLALRGGSSAPSFWAFAAGAAAGALAADAALEVTCGARESLPHLLVFHLGGVLLAAGLGGLALRRRPAEEALAAHRP
ncbi:MAG TPA: hypothetical protein VMG32_13360 [Anaeromyxobacteraceae bacterium]|nr:hypothetical protein [Anaeromyxobacteraceae bacterium]